MRNVWRQLKSIIPDPPLQVGTVSDIDGDSVTIDLPGGGSLRARSAATVTIGAKVFVRNGVVESTAPDLEFVEIEV